ncbi:MAG TPA: hypothetical protein VLI05_01095 [Candidatus Saccharimonadia bacterium]|nr:hypothetical protein [Candidatus Saccharimonadia bacterium]
MSLPDGEEKPRPRPATVGDLFSRTDSGQDSLETGPQTPAPDDPDELAPEQ